MAKSKQLIVQETIISWRVINKDDYISLTDITKRFDGGPALIENWLRNKNTVEFLGVWEQLNNPQFKTLEFEGFKLFDSKNSSD